MILRKIQNILFEFIFFKNKLLLKIIGVTFGSNVDIFSIASISCPHKLYIGDNVWIGKNVSLYAESGIRMGNNIIIAKDVSIISSDHTFINTSKSVKFQGIKIENKPIIIGSNV